MKLNIVNICIKTHHIELLPKINFHFKNNEPNVMINDFKKNSSQLLVAQYVLTHKNHRILNLIFFYCNLSFNFIIKSENIKREKWL